MNVFTKSIFLSLILITSFSCSKEEQSLLSLEIGASKTFTVSSETRWNKTSVQVEAGETYSFSSQGTWIDLNTETTADGYNDPLLDSFSYLKRDTSAKWFELVASVNTTTFYNVGVINTIKFNESGELTFFANDADDFYSNNSGSIKTTITRK